MTINEIINHLKQTSGLTEDEIRNLPIGMIALDDSSKPAYVTMSKFGLFVQKDINPQNNYIKMTVDIPVVFHKKRTNKV